MKRGAKSIILATIFTVLLSIFSISVIQAFQKQSAAIPGEVLDSNGDETTAVLMGGLIAVEMTSTGIGTIDIKRSQDKSTWITVKTYTNTSAGDRRKYIYENCGDGTLGRMDKVWYKAVLNGDPSSGSFRVRMEQ